STCTPKWTPTKVKPGSCPKPGAPPSAAITTDRSPVEILSSRSLVRPTDPARSQAFYGETLGLAVYRQFGPPDAPGVVYFCGNGLLEVSGHAAPTAQPEIGRASCRERAEGPSG